MNLKTIAAISIIAVSACAFGANPPGFIDDYDVAIKRAATEKKVILAVFSGSDWCHWCKVLESQFLSKQEFTDAVTNDLVCLYIDSPNDKSRISEKAREQNPKLVKKYDIKGYPTVMYIDAKGEKIADAKRMKLSPGEWGRYLVSASRTVGANGPLVEKHIKPFHDKIEAIAKKAKAEAEAVQKKGLEPAAMQVEFMRVLMGVQKEMADLKKEVEAYDFPKEVEAEKADLLKDLSQFGGAAPAPGTGMMGM